jgi:Glycine zipper
MTRKLMAAGILALCCGCSSMNNTESGMLGGGAIGGLLGAGVGALCHAPVAGAAIGAATGAAVGGIAGADADRQEHRAQVQAAAATAAAQQAAIRAPQYTEIVQMTRNGVPDANIIAQIRNSGAVYNPSPDDIMYLSQNGVSSAVIGAVQTCVPGTPPVVYGRPVYYDPYAPPVSVGVGVVGYRRAW